MTAPGDFRTQSSLGRALDPLRSRVAQAFRVTRASRDECLRSMLMHHRNDGVSYWFQLLISMGIATLGLVLGSAGVVIGAMLISPLMDPLVEVGMGLAVGSSVLVLRSLARTLASVVVVVGCAALLTIALPFHEVTSEIAARTAPTALDLFVAALCALMAGYTITRPASETTSTAAGTAIGIALVPPLCVVGWGVGTRRWDIVEGSGLLFTANLCAILLLTVLMFLLLAFERVDIGALEREALAAEGRPNRLANLLRAAFGSRYGALIRWGTPVILACAVYVPLRRALQEVAWQVRVRTDVTSIVDKLAPASESVRSTVVVAHREVSVQVVLVGDTQKAQDLAGQLRTLIGAAAGVVPSVNVLAVPDVKLVERPLEPLRVLPPKPPQPDLALPRQIITDLLQRDWPLAQAGPLLSWTLEVPAEGGPLIEVSHFGPALGPGGCALLARALSDGLASQVGVSERALSTDPIQATQDDATDWWSAFARAADATTNYEQLHICVGLPNTKQRRVDIGIRALVQNVLARLPEQRKHVTVARQWMVRLSLSPCQDADGGIRDSGNSDGPEE